MVITLQDVEVWTRLGVPEAERAAPQRVLVTVRFPVTPAPVDDIASTVDYSEVAEGVRAFAEARERLLVETFVRELAAELRVRFDLERVEVELKKFILPEARWVAVWHADPPATPRG